MITQLDSHNPHQSFPDIETALEDPDGLLAIGGDLSPQRLIQAYRNGIFPWYSDDSPIMWWSPNPRMVLIPGQYQPSRSLRKILRRGDFTVTCNQAFSQVIGLCAEPRHDDDGTWITEQMMHAYNQLHQLGVAHSIESWANNQLVGGFYGVSIGQVFFGESMFSRKSNASKAALATFLQSAHGWHYQLVDCQVYSNHLASLGAISIPRQQFTQLLNKHCEAQLATEAWQQIVASQW
jgi:leucyl/phenylalanyl-tRNA--protein transferase